jgi:hypothetical protein
MRIERHGMAFLGLLRRTGGTFIFEIRFGICVSHIAARALQKIPLYGSGGYGLWYLLHFKFWRRRRIIGLFLGLAWLMHGDVLPLA